MEQQVSTRVQQALEQIGEDEALTSDLTDPAATALLDWITQQIKAADAASDDAAFEQRVQAIRSAARTAARAAADEDVTAAVVVERAQAALPSVSPQALAAQPDELSLSAAAQAQALDTSIAEPAVSQIQTPDPSTVADPQRAEATRPGSVWNSLRRRLRRWAHRKG